MKSGVGILEDGEKCSRGLDVLDEANDEAIGTWSSVRVHACERNSAWLLV